jgi:hypothetical protein
VTCSTLCRISPRKVERVGSIRQREHFRARQTLEPPLVCIHRVAFVDSGGGELGGFAGPAFTGMMEDSTGGFEVPLRGWRGCWWRVRCWFLALATCLLW